MGDKVCISETEFNNFVNEFDRFKIKIADEISTIPERVLESKIKVRNGHTKELSIKTAIIENWERTSHLSQGEINIKLEDIEGYEQTWKLKELLSKLNQRPYKTFYRMGKIAKTLKDIIQFLQIAGIFYLIYLLTK